MWVATMYQSVCFLVGSIRSWPLVHGLGLSFGVHRCSTKEGLHDGQELPDLIDFCDVKMDDPKPTRGLSRQSIFVQHIVLFFFDAKYLRPDNVHEWFYLAYIRLLVFMFFLASIHWRMDCSEPHEGAWKRCGGTHLRWRRDCSIQHSPVEKLCAFSCWQIQFP